MQEILHSLGIEWQVLLAQSISFLVLIFFAKKFLFGPITEIMNQRRIKIDSDLKNAEQTKTDADNLRAEYEKKLADIAEEAKQRVAQSVADAENSAKRVREKAEEEIAELTKRHEERLAADRLEVRRELKNEVADITVEIANKVLREQMTPDMQSLVLNSVIKEIEQKQLN